MMWPLAGCRLPRLGLIGMWLAAIRRAANIDDAVFILNHPERWLWAILIIEVRCLRSQFAYELCIRKIDQAYWKA